jgi:4-diphosphocytidyl-2-C-methyl-D-erythritol kinase
MSHREARVTAHAKINLGLRVLAREQSGFHSIETIFARIAIGDAVTVHVRESGRVVECRDAETGPMEHNLAYRAAMTFAETIGWPAGFAIEIDKRVPVGGGLGGGSADAGAVLRALAALSPRPVPDDVLLRLGSTIGSDVPFLTSAAPLALAWSRGERMLALPPLPERHVALVVPSFAIATKDAYAWVSADRATGASQGGHTPVPHVFDLGHLSSWEALAPFTGNDFEEPVARRHPEVREIIQGLRRRGASIARMSGSGSTIYGVFEERPNADELARALPGQPGHVMLTHTLSRVPAVELAG